ncbi:radical SAM/SPASM domain-containing protein [Candidatus Margulisiibacteriota bacterium]
MNPNNKKSEELAAIVKGLGDRFPFPIALNIELTNACNLKCPMCPRTTSMTRSMGTMDFGLFKKIIDEAADNGIKRISLYLFGEPLMYPRVFDVIKYIKSRDEKIDVRLSTNCTTLNKKTSGKLLNSGLDILILSLDGATKRTYESVRVGSNFEEAIAAAQELLSLKKEKGLDKPFVSIQVIYMQETKDEVDAFIKMWAPYLSHHVHISVKEFADYSGQVDAPFERQELPDFNHMPCPRFWKNAVIYWDGTVGICCLDVNAALKIGKINGQTLKQVWNGEKLRKMREDILSKTFKGVEFCRKCRYGVGRLLYQYPSQGHGKDLDLE